MGQTDDVLVRRDRALGRITLNRPKALNALTLDMVRAIDGALDAFEGDAAIRTVVLDGAGERGFCAGGDMRTVWTAAKAGGSLPRDFWTEEYALDLRLSRFGKPIVAIMDGIVMGGGIGLAGHVAHRVATPALRSAMPEVGIGFAPDVGGTWLLSHAPGELGTHAALTGADFGAADALELGLADTVVEREELGGLLDALAEREPDAVLVRRDAGPAPLAAARAWIDEAYAGDDPVAIVARLAARVEPEARAAAEAIRGKSPTAVTVALAALRRAAALPSLAAALEMELHMALAFLDVPDFFEGIRAQLVDKDRSPAWAPARLEDVGDVAAFF